MKQISFAILLSIFATISQVIADVRAEYTCQSFGYVEINHNGRVKDIELEEFTLHFEGPYMVMQGGFSWFLSTKFPYKINTELTMVSGNQLGVTFIFEKGQLTLAAIYPSTWSEATHMRGMTVIQAKCDLT